MNRVFVVERFIYRVKYEKYEPPEDEIMLIGEILGQPTKKLSVVLSRYDYVVNKYVERRCIEVDANSICIYSWNRRSPFKVFPLAMHLYGTVILFSNSEPMDVLAYPIPKALSYGKSPGLPKDEYCDVVPFEVTKRIDGWQITAYFNPLLGRWIFATRHTLHNMYFERGKLIVEPVNSIANPYIYVADRIAQDEGVYTVLDRFRGWTFTFVLEGPEPAITKPPYPLGEDYRKYRLYLLMARDTSGRLYTWSETSKLIPYRFPEHLEPKPLQILYEDVVKMMDTRSYFAYIGTDDPENPIIAELESEVYPETMYVKYLYDAKSAALLITENLTDKLAKIIDKRIFEAVTRVGEYIDQLSSTLNNIDARRAPAIAQEVVSLLKKYRQHADISVEELTRMIKERNTKRIIRKILSIILENHSLISRDTFDVLSDFVNELMKCTFHKCNVNQF